MSKKSEARYIPRAKNLKAWTPKKGKVGAFENKEPTKKRNTKKPKRTEINSCTDKDWQFLIDAGYILVPRSEL